MISHSLIYSCSRYYILVCFVRSPCFIGCEHLTQEFYCIILEEILQTFEKLHNQYWMCLILSQHAWRPPRRFSNKKIPYSWQKQKWFHANFSLTKRIAPVDLGFLPVMRPNDLNSTYIYAYSTYTLG